MGEKFKQGATQIQNERGNTMRYGERKDYRNSKGEVYKTHVGRGGGHADIYKTYKHNGVPREKIGSYNSNR